MRPRNSIRPSARQRTRSPVRYMRARLAGERVGDEPLGGQLGTIVVAAREPVAADVQLAGHADRHRAAASRRARTGSCWRSAARSRPGPRARSAAPSTRSSSRSGRTGSRPRRRARTAARRARGGNASPPQNARRPGVAPGAQPPSTSIRHVAGVACITLTRSAAISSSRRWGSTVAASGATTTRAPTISGR